MNTASLILAILVISATAHAQLVMRYDGKTASGPMKLPRTAQAMLDGSGTVSSLAGADWTTRNRCGYYEAVRAVADPGMVVTARQWPTAPTDGVFREVITEQITQDEYDAQQAAIASAPMTVPLGHVDAVSEPGLLTIPKADIETSDGYHGIILQDSQGRGWKLVAGDDGTMIAVQVHAMSKSTAGQRAMIDAKRADHAAKKAVHATAVAEAKNQGNGNSWKAAVAAINARLDALEALTNE